MKLTYLLIIWLVLTCTSAAAQPGILTDSKSVLLLDADTNEVIYSKHSDAVRPIASITKLMNAYVNFHHLLDMNQLITITEEDVIGTTINGQLSGQSLKVGESYTRDILLTLSLMNSQNRAAHALAREFPGGKAAFVEAMNSAAQDLLMVNTKFTDPTGLYNTNISTSDDLAKLILAASQTQQLANFSITKNYLRKFNSTNALTNRADWELILQKTGFIRDAGRCMVALISVQSSRRIIMVLLNASSSAARSRDATKLKFWIDHQTLPTTEQLNALDPTKLLKSNKKSKRKIHQK